MNATLQCIFILFRSKPKMIPSEYHLDMLDFMSENEYELINEDERLLMNCLETEIEATSGVAKGEGHKSQAKVQMAPKIMLQNGRLRKYFKPVEFSVGPLHANNPKLLSKRGLKNRLARKFVQENGETWRSLFDKFKPMLETKCDLNMYMKELKISDSCELYSPYNIASSLFLDGCAVLQFIRSCVSGKLFKVFNTDYSQQVSIQQDLFMLENQIPFVVLTLLMDLIGDKEKEKAYIKDAKIKGKLITATLPFSFAILKFIQQNNILAPVDSSSYIQSRKVGVFDGNEPSHLLDLLRRLTVFGSFNSNAGCRDDTLTFRSRLACFSGEKRSSPFEDFREILKLMQSDPDEGDCFVEQSFRNVQELKSTGIKVKRSDDCSLRSVCFSSCYITGSLKLPTLIVQDSTVLKLLNLVAYETFPCNNYEYDTKYMVTSYLKFLDLIIDNEQDVKDLREAHVLQNHLGSDAEAARLFNDMIGLNYLPMPVDNYEDVKSKIQKHYERRCATWIAQVYNDHFSNPWTIVALLAAAAVLSLTIVQTWYAVHPTD